MSVKDTNVITGYDKKFDYISRTLSRTKRKEYENYVVNAIWNRLDNLDIKPVSQQYIDNPDKGRGHFFIDLYFPQVNIGIECDEAHHDVQKEEDLKRELSIFQMLRKVSDTTNYKALLVQVFDQSLEDIERQINSHVLVIKKAFDLLQYNGKLKRWDFDMDAREYFGEKTEISITDDIDFRTIVEACSVIFGTNYDGMQLGWFFPKFADTRQNDYIAWFPKLAVDGKARVRNFNNQLSQDGLTITEYNEKGEDMTVRTEKGRLPRITFAYATDKVTRQSGYRFVGIFQYQETIKGVNHYKRIADKFQIVNGKRSDIQVEHQPVSCDQKGLE
jgi:very-short-patch-repair endonuclease